MFLSFVIPAYNVEQYLRGCVDSILANDCTDCEIILVDDGSTDGVTPQLCDGLAAEHPALIRVIHQENKGPGGARNTGLLAACGEYIFFVDSDDTIAPNSTQILRQAVRQRHCDIITFQMATHTENGPRIPMEICRVYNRPVTLPEQPELLLSIPAMWARIWKRDLFLNSGVQFPDRCWYGEDLRTTLKLMALAGSIDTLPDVLYFYLDRPGSIMNSRNLDRNRDILDSLEDLRLWFQTHGLLEQYRQELCYLAVDHAALAATVRVAKNDPASAILPELLGYVQNTYPEYRTNVHVLTLSRARRLALRLVEGRHYRLLRLLFLLKGK